MQQLHPVDFAGELRFVGHPKVRDSAAETDIPLK